MNIFQKVQNFLKSKCINCKLSKYGLQSPPDGDGDPGTVDLSRHGESPFLSISNGPVDFVYLNSGRNTLHETLKRDFYAQNAISPNCCLSSFGERREPTSPVGWFGRNTPIWVFSDFGSPWLILNESLGLKRSLFGSKWLSLKRYFSSKCFKPRVKSWVQWGQDQTTILQEYWKFPGFLWNPV